MIEFLAIKSGLSFLRNNWQIILGGILVGYLIYLIWSYGEQRYIEGQNDIKAKFATAERKKINENLDIRKNQDAVIRPSDVTYINSLLDGSY